ncbi:unnamed protein product [Arctia plantaginis]|uniref:Uncharacterized protein n=1 Tax=Arctia plantaginis TaxID=874455 RepID=A0A8S1BSX3_ARCPL|nr:unnamed protein product [Arctia plantaginis]
MALAASKLWKPAQTAVASAHIFGRRPQRGEKSGRSDAGARAGLPEEGGRAWRSSARTGGVQRGAARRAARPIRAGCGSGATPRLTTNLPEA